MAANKRPSFLKRQKEQARLARANEKREAKQARRQAKMDGRSEAAADADMMDPLDGPADINAWLDPEQRDAEG